MRTQLFVLLAVVLLWSCSSSRLSRSSNVSFRSFPHVGSVTQSQHSLAGELGSSGKPTYYQESESSFERIMVYNASIRIVVNNPDTTNVALTEVASRYGGYVQRLGSTRSIIRVRATNLEEALSDISKLGRVESRSISGDNVTEQYMDYQIRLENAIKARERYLELLARAENVEAALKVERELERLNGRIDSLKGKLKRLDHLSSYSTITVRMTERVKPGILGYVGIGLYRSVKWLFVRN